MQRMDKGKISFMSINNLDSFQYAATSNFGKTRVAFSKRAIPTPSQNCNHRKHQ